MSLCAEPKRTVKRQANFLPRSGTFWCACASGCYMGGDWSLWTLRILGVTDMFLKVVAAFARRATRRVVLAWIGGVAIVAVCAVVASMIAPGSFIPMSGYGLTQESFDNIRRNGQTLEFPAPSRPSYSASEVTVEAQVAVATAQPAPTAAAMTAVTVEVERQVEVAREVVVTRQAQTQYATAPTATVQQDYGYGRRATPTPVAHWQPQPSGGETPHTVTFQDYARSRMVHTRQDAISTFSLDTDRTSFQLALNWTRNGYEVDPVSVRAEEWINAFDYGYDTPSHPDRFNIATDVFPHPVHGARHMARIAFQAPEATRSAPLNITLVLDASGSMDEGDRVEIARAAAESIVDSLGNSDRVSIVHFTNNVLVEYTVDSHRPRSRSVRSSIANLAPHDSTNVQAGLNLGVKLADRMRLDRPEALNYVILMSDGVANVDATNPFAILESAHDADAWNPLRLITLGVGIANYNDVLLEQLAQHGNGWYRYLSTVDDGRSFAAQGRWQQLASPFADQTRAQVRWDPAYVQSWRLIGYENRVTSDESFTQPLKKFAEIPSGTATTAFYELVLTPAGQRDLGSAELGSVELRWVTPSDQSSNIQHTSIGTTPSRGADGALEFGAIVALASDAYSGLSGYELSRSGVRNELEMLERRLHSLRGEYARTQAYKDFKYVLAHITSNVPYETTSGSGYSR